MKTALKIGLLFAGLWILCKMIFFYAGMSLDTYKASALINNFFLLCAISITLFLFKRKNNYEEVSFLTDVKEAIIGGIAYTVIVALFSQLYYSKIDPSFIDKKIDQRMEIVKQTLASDAEFAKYKENTPSDELLTREEIYTKVRKSAEATLNPNVAMVIMLLGFIMLTMIYSIIVTFFFRKILLKGIN